MSITSHLNPLLLEIPNQDTAQKLTNENNISELLWETNTGRMKTLEELESHWGGRERQPMNAKQSHSQALSRGSKQSLNGELVVDAKGPAASVPCSAESRHQAVMAWEEKSSVVEHDGWIGNTVNTTFFKFHLGLFNVEKH